MTLSCQNLSSLSHLHVIWIAVKRLHKERINCLLHHDRHCPFAGSAAVENILTNAHTLHKHIHILYTFGQACAHVDIHSNTCMSSFKSMHVCRHSKLTRWILNNTVMVYCLWYYIYTIQFIYLCVILSHHTSFIPHLLCFTFSWFPSLVHENNNLALSFSVEQAKFLPCAPNSDFFLIPTENWTHSSLFQSTLPGGTRIRSILFFYLLLQKIVTPKACVKW